ncbi:MAG: type II toxin-antitoxin system VapC family toxin [Sphingomonadales bacterium]
MIVLDTNVVSEMMRTQPDSNVYGWLESSNSNEIALSVVSIAEIKKGLNLLPDGKRKVTLDTQFEAVLETGFLGRILSFGRAEAATFGALAADRKKAGVNTGDFDLMIAATAKEHRAIVATRNTKDFKGCGVAIINPWLTA